MTPYSWEDRSRPQLFDSFSPLRASTPAFSNPDRSTKSSSQLSCTPHRQSLADSSYQTSFSMPNFSSMTNSELVDALLTPSNLEIQQERQGSSLYLSSPARQTSSKRARPSAAPSNTTSGIKDLALADTDGWVAPAPASNKRPRRQQKSKSALSTRLEEEYVEIEPESDVGSPPPVRKPRRSGRTKKLTVPVEDTTIEVDDDDQALFLEEEKPKTTTTTKRLSKARPGRLIRKKPIGTAVPKTLSEAGPADRMMWVWKNEGKTWEEIRAEWKRMTGIEPGGSSLSVRYIKLNENLARNGAAGDLELLKFRKEAEDELLSQLWTRVAEKMLAYSPESEHNPKDLQKRYNMIVRSGYDVEKLIRDDIAKHEAEESKLEVTAEDDNFNDEFEFEVPSIEAYDNPVANETAACLREPEATMSTDHSESYMGEALPSTPHDLIHGFGPIRILQHEVDGLNEYENVRSMKIDTPFRKNNEYLSYGPAMTTVNPLTLRKNAFGPVIPHSSPLQNALVEYNSESE